SKETRDKIVIRCVRSTGHNDPTHIDCSQPDQVRLQGTHGSFRLKLNQTIKLAHSHIDWCDSQCLIQSINSSRWLFRLGRKVQFNPVFASDCRQEAAPGLKTRLDSRTKIALLPENKRAGQGRMTTEIHFDGRRKP